MVARPDSDFHQLPGTPDLKIDAMFAFVAQGPEGEGVMGASMVIAGREMMMPLVGADLNRIKSLLPYAKMISEQSGQPFRIYRFDNKTDITDQV
jgi:hypothetical protein